METRKKKIKCEIYRDIKGYEGIYQVSNLGNVKSARNNKILKQTNHIDGNKENNNMENLEWVSHSENIKHSYHVLKQKRNNVSVKCIETGVVYSSCKEAGDKTGINKCSINHVINGVARKAGGYSWVRV